MLLSTRSWNCLINAGIKSVDDLREVTTGEMLHWHNLGKGSLAEIMEFAEKHGFSLKEELEKDALRRMHADNRDLKYISGWRPPRSD